MTPEILEKIQAALDRVVSHYNAFRLHHHAGAGTLNKFVYPCKGTKK